MDTIVYLLCILPLKSMFMLKNCTHAMHCKHKTNKTYIIVYALRIYETCKLEWCMWTSFWVVVVGYYNMLPAADGVPIEFVSLNGEHSFLFINWLYREYVHGWCNDEFEQSGQRRSIFISTLLVYINIRLLPDWLNHQRTALPNQWP